VRTPSRRKTTVTTNYAKQKGRETLAPSHVICDSLCNALPGLILACASDFSPSSAFHSGLLQGDGGIRMSMCEGTLHLGCHNTKGVVVAVAPDSRLHWLSTSERTALRRPPLSLPLVRRKTRKGGGGLALLFSDSCVPPFSGTVGDALVGVILQRFGTCLVTLKRGSPATNHSG
jgi:hypothetical protein